MEWKPPSKEHCTHRSLRYRISCWEKENEPLATDEHVTEYDGTSYRLEDLQPETTYCVNIVSSSTKELCSNHSETIEFTTGKEIRTAERIVERTEMISVEIGLNLYQIPITKLTWHCKMAERFAYETNGDICKFMGNLHFTILLVGSSGCGKESLINNFINYVFNVDLTDPFRFQLIDPSREENVYENVRVYDIHHSKGFRTNYSLTIIDTPNFHEEDPENNKKIAKTIEEFFKDKNGIQKVNLVGLVLNSSVSHFEPINLYIFCLLISLFGEDIKTNINFLLTSAEDEDEWLWNDVVEAELVQQNQTCHKFDSSPNFCYVRNFENFFYALPESAESTVVFKPMTDEKNRLEVAVDQLTNRIKLAVPKLKGLMKTKKKLVDHWAEMEANLDVEYEIEINVGYKVDLPFGQVVVTNCTECKRTCLTPDCGLTDGLFECGAIDHLIEENVRTCRVCPNKCLWNLHANESFKWINQEENQTVSLNAVKRKYETDLMLRNLTSQEFAERLGADVEAAKREIVELIQTVLDLATQVNTIAKQQGPYSTPQCVSVIYPIINVLSTLTNSEEGVARLSRNIELIEKLKELSNSAISIVTVPAESSDSDSSGENYVYDYDPFEDYGGSSDISMSDYDCSCC